MSFKPGSFILLLLSVALIIAGAIHPLLGILGTVGYILLLVFFIAVLGLRKVLLFFGYCLLYFIIDLAVVVVLELLGLYTGVMVTVSTVISFVVTLIIALSVK